MFCQKVLLARPSLTCLQSPRRKEGKEIGFTVVATEIILREPEIGEEDGEEDE